MSAMASDIIDMKRQQIREDRLAVGYLCNDELYTLLGIKKASSGKSIKQLSGMDWRQLTQEGYTDKDALKLLTFFELARRLECYTEDAKPKIASPEDVYRLLYPQMRECKKEMFIIICLDTKNQIIYRKGGMKLAENIPFREGVPEKIRTEITIAENSLGATLKRMYECPTCGSEMFTTEYPVVACPKCGHEQNGPNDL